MKKNQIIFYLLIFILYLLFGQSYIVVLPSTKKCVRNEIRMVFYILEIGDSKKEIRQKINSLNLSHLHFFKKSTVIFSPFEWGAKNWEIYFNIVDDKLSGIMIRTADSIRQHPKNAPPDKGDIFERWKTVEIIEVD
ncbi:hypothetical protein PN36_34935 [Candidatus Thiomargarita nelsonii]|uniref:Uncharacterized protein n=1 Tax=Candidatus Thiomargarita nelsonii TaxID=1003181 RepID=A0A4E0QWI6_9GAMM|nr:hypothetical protein PN36_34935 [Candidatus Thiomargarita nelsonii]